MKRHKRNIKIILLSSTLLFLALFIALKYITIKDPLDFATSPDNKYSATVYLQYNILTGNEITFVTLKDSRDNSIIIYSINEKDGVSVTWVDNKTLYISVSTIDATVKMDQFEDLRILYGSTRYYNPQENDKI